MKHFLLKYILYILIEKKNYNKMFLYFLQGKLHSVRERCKRSISCLKYKAIYLTTIKNPYNIYKHYNQLYIVVKQ